MCGIVGVINTPEAAEEIFLALQNLQHRGQDGGGIVTADTDRFFEHRGAGLLDIAFPEENFRRLKGTMGIGHTRYATVGQQDNTLLQPFLSNPAGIAIAHNGNILNYPQLRDRISDIDPLALQTGCDTEMLLWHIVDGLQGQPVTVETMTQSIRQLSHSLVGSYSVVGVIQGLGLFAFRDPYGFRPLVMGQRLDDPTQKPTVAFASESAALEFLDFTILETVQPGEVVFVLESGQVLRHTFESPEVKHCMFEWVYFARVESVLDEVPVYQARMRLGVELAHAIRDIGLTPDIVVPVPETSRIAAIALAEKLNVPFREVLIKNRYVNRTFILESQPARQAAIRRKLYPVASEIKGKKVLVVDDSIVRGNTAIQIIELLRKSGAKEIYLTSTCPPIRYPCYYGIDFPDHEELLAGKHSDSELAKVLGVDRIIYQSLPGLETALQKEKKLCTACLTGDYPTCVAEGQRFSTYRRSEREAIRTL